MKQELYGWMENLAVFYILLTCVLHLVPQEKYQRYVRFFMGLVLTVMLCSPAFSIFGESQNLLEEFEIQYEQEELLRQQREQANLQEVYLRTGYEKEIEKNLETALLAQGIVPREIQVELLEERAEVKLKLEKAPDEETKRRLEHVLWEICKVGEGEYEIETAQDGETAISGASAPGAFGGGGASADTEE